jgi:CRISPR/Cas system CSM-associated protein Csm2 small subunit
MSPIEKQIEVANRLYEMMLADHRQRTSDNVLLHQTLDSLMHKIDERNAEITELKQLVNLLRKHGNP